MRFLEPAWKLIFSSKAILAYLWKKHENHENLLPAYFSADELNDYKLSHEGTHWVAKPRFGREGDGIVYSNCEDNKFETFKDFSDSTQSHENRLIPLKSHPDDGHERFGTDLMDMGKITAALQSKKVAERASNNLMDHKYGGTHTEDNEAPSLSLNQGPPIFQQYHAPARLHGRSVVTSCWVVRGAPVAACFREDTAKTTNNDSCFVPHYINGPEFKGPDMYRMSENEGKLRSQLYGSAPLITEGDSYSEGGFGRISEAASGGGGDVARNPHGVSGPGWFGRFWNGNTHQQYDHGYDAKNAAKNKGGNGSTG